MLTAMNFFSEMCQQEKSEKDAMRQEEEERLKNDRILKINHNVISDCKTSMNVVV